MTMIHIPVDEQVLTLYELSDLMMREEVRELAEMQGFICVEDSDSDSIKNLVKAWLEETQPDEIYKVLHAITYHLYNKYGSV